MDTLPKLANEFGTSCRHVCHINGNGRAHIERRHIRSYSEKVYCDIEQVPWRCLHTEKPRTSPRSFSLQVLWPVSTSPVHCSFLMPPWKATCQRDGHRKQPPRMIDISEDPRCSTKVVSRMKCSRPTPLSLQVAALYACMSTGHLTHALGRFLFLSDSCLNLFVVLNTIDVQIMVSNRNL